MKKIILAVIITIMSMCLLGTTAATVFMAFQYNNAKNEINELEEEINELRDNKNNNSSSGYNENYKEEDTFNDPEVEQQTTYKRLYPLTYNELMRKINNKDSFVLLVSQTWCSHCQNYKPVLNKVLNDYNIDAYVIEIDELAEEEYNDIVTTLYIEATPNTLFFKNGQESVTNRLFGESDYDSVVSRLKENGFIK